MDHGRVQAAYAARAGDYIRAVDGGAIEDEGDRELVRRHLTGLVGPVFDLGCGPGHWTADLHARGVDVTGVDLVPGFIAHARATHPGVPYRVGSMTELDVAEHSLAGILSWYSTIHQAPGQFDVALAGFRTVLRTSGVLVLGFFAGDDSEDEVAVFDHAVVTAHRWPVDLLVDHLRRAGFAEVERRTHRRPERPDRRYAVIVARAA